MTDQTTEKQTNSENSSSLQAKSQNGHKITSPIPQPSPPQKTPLILRILPLIVLTTAFIGWGFTAKIPVKVVGQSIVLIPRSSVSFQSRSSGRISQLRVKVGDQVKKGQVLAIIEADEIREQLLTKQQELAEYIRENQEVTTIEQERSRVKLESIRSQKAAIPVQIAANQEQINSNKKEQIAIAQQRKTYQQRIKQIDEIDQLISERYEAYNKLVEEGAVAPLDSSRIQAEDVLQKNLNEKTQLSAKLDDLDAKNIQLTAQNESLIAQNQNLQAQLESLTSQESEISLDDLESDLKRQNTIDNLRRDIENVKVKLETASQVISAYNGTITEISVNIGDYIQTGTNLAQIKVANPPNTQEVALAFFTPEDANRIRQGMKVEVTPNLLTERRFGGTRERFGGIIGTIQTISQETITPQEAASLVGNSQLAEALLQNPVPYSAPDPGEAKNLPVVQVGIELERNSDTPSGYQWTKGQGPNDPIPEGSIGESRVTIEKRTPISYLMPILRWMTGIYYD